MSDTKRVLMVAAENDALPGAKVGGVGDVIRDLPLALAKNGVVADVVQPSYGFLVRLGNLQTLPSVDITFGNERFTVQFFKLEGAEGEGDNYIVHHPKLFPKGESVYCNDEDSRPFATDASKFAFFNLALAQALLEGVVPRPEVIHCHDWHTAYLIILMKFAEEYRGLAHLRTVFTIHNIAMQGIRPFVGDESSLHEWYPNLRYSIDKLADPRYRDCVNPMRAAILLADKVHTVSPSYALEILQPSDVDKGIYGGDGLENDLRARKDQGDLIGILNGSEYPKLPPKKNTTRAKVSLLMEDSVLAWAAKSASLQTAHWLAEKRIEFWKKKKSLGFTVTSVGRLTEQKVRLLQAPLADGRCALQGVLDVLGENGTLIILGSGDPALELFVTQVSAKNSNLIFLNGYSDELSKQLYPLGDLFLMPSSFEPCGISQLLAMRSGQPCLVNGVGGLKDTVKHTETGFVFNGADTREQAQAMVNLFSEALAMFGGDTKQWKAIATAAAKERFTWEKSSQRYIDELYGFA